MTATGQVKDAIVESLQEAGIPAVGTYENLHFARSDAAVAAVGLRTMALKRTGLTDYLGERYDPVRGTTVEVYGRTIELAVSVDLYAPEAALCDSAAEQAAEVLMSALPEGLTAEHLRWDETAWEEKYGLFLRRGTVDYRAQFTTETADETVLTDFKLRGVVSK